MLFVVQFNTDQFAVRVSSSNQSDNFLKSLSELVISYWHKILLEWPKTLSFLVSTPHNCTRFKADVLAQKDDGVVSFEVLMRPVHAAHNGSFHTAQSGRCTQRTQADAGGSPHLPGYIENTGRCVQHTQARAHSAHRQVHAAHTDRSTQCLLARAQSEIRQASQAQREKIAHTGRCKKLGSQARAHSAAQVVACSAHKPEHIEHTSRCTQRTQAGPCMQRSLASGHGTQRTQEGVRSAHRPAHAAHRRQVHTALVISSNPLVCTCGKI